MSDNEKQPQDQHQALPDDGIGFRIKAAREAKKLSQIDMHKKTGLSRTVLINYEAGRHKPGSREIKLICDTLSISPNYLIYGTEKPHEIKQGLAEKILSMDAGAAFVQLSILIPLVSAILGHDEKRLILEFIETVLKARSPELPGEIMSIIDTVPNPKDIDLERSIDMSNDPEATRKFIDSIKQRAANIPKRNK